jgi:hypothetical protein
MSDTPPEPTAITPPDPPAPSAPTGQLPPPPGDVAGGTPEPSRISGRTWLVAIGAGLAVLIAVAVAVARTSGPSDELPDAFADVHRLHTPEVQQLEDQLHAIKVGDAKIEVAGYGSNDDATLILFRYSNLPARPSVAAVPGAPAAGSRAPAGPSISMPRPRRSATAWSTGVSRSPAGCSRATCRTRTVRSAPGSKATTSRSSWTPERRIWIRRSRTRRRHMPRWAEVERVRGIEPPFQAWEACVLPLNHTRVARPPGRPRQV